MTIPTNDARALHDLLARLQHSQSTPSSAWAAILEAKAGSVDFAVRHAEVVGLFTGTMQQVASFPDHARARAERYAPKWWRAVVAPDLSWGSGNSQASSAVDDNALDQLDAAADLVESRMTGSLASPDKTDLTQLRDVCQEWADAVLAEDDLADALKMNLLQDLRHIMWLIENAEIFGVARVAAAAETVVGQVVTAALTLPEAKRGVWVERGKKLLTAVMYLGALYQGIDVSVMLASGASNFIAELTAGSPGGPPSLPSTPIPDGGELPGAPA